MPPMMNENFSPERPSRHSRSRFKGSSPMDIPVRRKSPLNSSGNPGSADMIFDMSPVSLPPSPISSKNHAATARSPTSKDSKPFMYNVPIFRISPDGENSKRRHENRPHNDFLRRTDSLDAFQPGPEFDDYKNGESSSSHTWDYASSSQDLPRPKAKRSTTKITGFAPINEHQPPIFDRPPHPTIPLNPPPRSPTSPPSFGPHASGKGRDIAYSQADPSLFEFQRHLLRRIGNQDPSRQKSLYAH